MVTEKFSKIRFHSKLLKIDGTAHAPAPNAAEHQSADKYGEVSLGLDAQHSRQSKPLALAFERVLWAVCQWADGVFPVQYASNAVLSATAAATTTTGAPAAPNEQFNCKRLYFF